MFIKRFKSFFRNTIVRNMIFWTISFLVLLRLFTRTDEVRTIDLIYTFLFHVPLITGVVFNQIMMRNFLKPGKYLAYWLSVLLAILLIVQIYPLTFDLLAGWIFPDYYFVAVYEWYEMLGIGFIYVSLSILLYFANEWASQQEALTRLSQLEERSRQAELQAMRAQINPHFLFNSLNTIYGESLKKSDAAPELILQLSDILRYVVDHMEKEQVLLSSEIEYLNKFISIQKRRVTFPSRIDFTVTGEAGKLMVPPLLLITFIENCFKHGSVSEKNDFIKISIRIEDRYIHLETQNTVAAKSELTDQSVAHGMTNAKKRLELVYPESHRLDYGIHGDIFQLSLTMNAL